MIDPEVVIVTSIDTGLVPSLMVIEYWPADAGVVAWSETTTTCPLASVEILPVMAEYVPVVTPQVADGVIHAAGMSGEAVNVSSVLPLKPLAVMNICPFAVLAGAKVV